MGLNALKIRLHQAKAMHTKAEAKNWNYCESGVVSSRGPGLKTAAKGLSR
jgi:hypothetical protein